jgi:hypothetical protein
MGACRAEKWAGENFARPLLFGRGGTEAGRVYFICGFFFVLLLVNYSSTTIMTMMMGGMRCSVAAAGKGDDVTSFPRIVASLLFLL